MKIYFLTFCCLSMMACGLFDDANIIKYEVTGTALKVRVTMHNADGGIEELDNVSVPWSTEFKPNFEPSGEYDNYGLEKYFYSAYISARNNGDLGSVTVKIYKNDNLIGTATSNGAYVTATISKKIEF